MTSNLTNYQIKDKVCLVTGAAGLLGSQHATAILDIGGSVILTDICDQKLTAVKEQLIIKYGSERILSEKLDVTSPNDIEAVHEKLQRRDISVDILINNAAIDPKVGPQESITNTSRLENFDLNEWNLQIAVGLTGAFLCSKTFGKSMADRDGGIIINVASDLSVMSPDQRLYRVDGLQDDLQSTKPVTYSVIKSGLIGLTRYLSTYWAERGVRCNAISPGGVFNGQSDEFVAKLERLIPLGRMAASDEYMGTIQYVCSDASRYLNGQNIIVDGGRSVW